jgi:hypothetical protein
MRAAVLCLLAALTGAVGAAQTPDCVLFFSFSAVGNSQQFDNRTRGCQDWTIAYTAQGFATLSLITQSAPDAGATPGAWATFAGTIVNGINPNTAITQATTRFTGYFPWMRVRLDATTGGPGTVLGVLYGWKIPPGSAGGGAVVVSGTVTAENQLFDGNAGTWFNEFGCTEQATISLTAGTTQIIAAAASEVIRVCHISISWDATVDFSLVSGTGANCATGPANLTGVYRAITAIALDMESSHASIRAAASQAVCVTQTGAANGGGVVVFARY